MVRVVCVRIINPVTGEEVNEHPGVHVGREYPVLAAQAHSGRRAKLRILADDGTPTLFDAAMFTASEMAIPGTWVMRVREGGIVDLGPAAWLEPGFWERYFDRERSAVDLFDAEVRAMGGQAEE